MAELARPRSFARHALRDLAAAPRIAGRLFSARLRGRARKSLLGYARLVLPAIGMTIVCLYLKAAGILTAGAIAMPYPVYVLSGVLLWQIFLEALNQPIGQLLAARQLVSRSAIPHEAILLAAGYDVALSAAVRVGLLLVVAWAYGAPILPGVGLLPGIAALIVLGLAIGLWASPMAMLYDDIRDAMTMVATFWFFLTPIAYRGADGGVAAFNPVTPLLDTARFALVGGGIGGGFLPVSAMATTLLVGGWLFYRLAKPHVVERLG